MDRRREDGLHLSIERSRGKVERLPVDLLVIIRCGSDASLQFRGRRGQTDGHEKDGIAGGRSSTERDKAVVKAGSRDDGKVSMNTLKVTSADIVHKLACLTDQAMDLKIQVGFRRRQWLGMDGQREGLERHRGGSNGVITSICW